MSENVFTDDDLKRLKDGMSTLRMIMDVTEYSLGADELEALLARLEAAEEHMKTHHVSCALNCPELEAWRKACGK